MKLTKTDQEAIAKLYVEAIYHDVSNSVIDKKLPSGEFKSDKTYDKSQRNLAIKLARVFDKYDMHIYIVGHDDPYIYDDRKLSDALLDNFKNVGGDYVDILEFISTRKVNPGSNDISPKEFLQWLRDSLEDYSFEKLHDSYYIVTTPEKIKVKVKSLHDRSEEKWNQENPNYGKNMEYDDDGVSPSSYNVRGHG
jgi:hypothetical protein